MTHFPPPPRWSRVLRFFAKIPAPIYGCIIAFLILNVVMLIAIMCGVGR